LIAWVGSSSGLVAVDVVTGGWRTGRHAVAAFGAVL
jgi:hypothetical protein